MHAAAISRMSTEHPEPAVANNLLKMNSDDVGWEYGVLVDASNKDKVKCKLCDKEMKGGIYRLKEHLAHEGKNVKKCPARTQQAMEAKEKCKKALADAKRKREEKTVHELEIREEVHVSRVGTDSDEVTCVGSSEPHKLGCLLLLQQLIEVFFFLSQHHGGDCMDMKHQLYRRWLQGSYL